MPIDNINQIKLLIATESHANDAKVQLIKFALYEECSSNQYNDIVESSLYQRVCGFFAFEIKHNEVVNKIFQSQLLPNIDIKVSQIIDSIASVGVEYLPVLQNIEEKLESNNKSFSEIKDILNNSEQIFLSKFDLIIDSFNESADQNDSEILIYEEPSYRPLTRGEVIRL